MNTLDWKFSNSWYDLYSIDENKNSSQNFDLYPPQNPAFKLVDNINDKIKKTYARYYGEDFKNPL